MVNILFETFKQTLKKVQNLNHLLDLYVITNKPLQAINQFHSLSFNNRNKYYKFVFDFFQS